MVRIGRSFVINNMAQTGETFCKEGQSFVSSLDIRGRTSSDKEEQERVSITC